MTMNANEAAGERKLTSVFEPESLAKRGGSAAALRQGCFLAHDTGNGGD